MSSAAPNLNTLNRLAVPQSQTELLQQLLKRVKKLEQANEVLRERFRKSQCQQQRHEILEGGSSGKS